jgi:pimeloyl-ACP methyl ester carboxylesterase
VVERGWQIAHKTGAPAIAAGVHAFHGRAGRENAVQTCAAPVVFVNGEFDRAERSRRFAERLPHWSFRQVDGVGHYLPLEAPTALTAITGDVLASVT